MRITSPFAVALTGTETETLTATNRRPTAEMPTVFRAQIVLHAADGATNADIAGQWPCWSALRWVYSPLEQRRLGHMTGTDQAPQIDITDLILDEHQSFRDQFEGLLTLRLAGDSLALATEWQRLADLLEVHASAEEEILYPVLLKEGGGQAAAETKDAVGDHNEIRDAIRAASADEPGSDPWWQAVLACRKANDEHLAEEERDVLPDFRKHSEQAQRSRLGAQWVAFHAEHRSARGISGHDIDPQEYVADNS